MQAYAAQLLDVFAGAARTTQAHPAALGVVLLVLSIAVTYGLTRGTVLAYRFVTRGDSPPQRVMVCHTVSPGAAEAMKAWASKMQ